MNILFLTCCVVSEKSLSHLDRLFSSISIFTKKSTVHKARQIVLLQNIKENSNDFQLIRKKTPGFAKLLTTEKIVSLSKGRNLLLEYCDKHHLLAENTIVAFPDDDCWYPENTLNKFLGFFEKNRCLDFLFSKYSSTPICHHFSCVETDWSLATIPNLVRNASSNTIFFRSDLLGKVGRFDETLGLGSQKNGGEDLDFSIRLFLQSRLVAYFPKEFVGHRDKDISQLPRYFSGSYSALKKHALRKPSLLFQFLRKTFVGIVLYFRGDIDLKEFHLF